MHKKVYSSNWFLKKSNIFTFSNSKSAAKYANIDRTESLDAGFQHILLVQISEFFTILLWNSNN